LAIYCSCSNLLAMYESSGAQKSQISDETWTYGCQLLWISGSHSLLLSSYILSRIPIGDVQQGTPPSMFRNQAGGLWALDLWLDNCCHGVPSSPFKFLLPLLPCELEIKKICCGDQTLNKTWKVATKPRKGSNQDWEGTGRGETGKTMLPGQCTLSHHCCEPNYSLPIKHILLIPMIWACKFRSWGVNQLGLNNSLPQVVLPDASEGRGRTELFSATWNMN
jgi:hypothetical protein